jgi:hypothetical protein
LERYSLLVVDEIGYLPLELQAANLLFALVARRYERGSITVTSNRGFEAWGEILGDAMVAAAMIDRLVTTPRSSPSKVAPYLCSSCASTRWPGWGVGVVGGGGRVRADAQPYLGPRSGVVPGRRHDG